MVFLVIVLALFASLTVGSCKYLRIRRSNQTPAAVSNPYRLTPHTGVEAVELKMKSGKTCRIGTNPRSIAGQLETSECPALSSMYIQGNWRIERRLVSCR